MPERMSFHEMRRRAPLHYLLRAENARYVAYLLSEELRGDKYDSLLNSAAKAVQYGGTPTIAVWEAFLREASLAVELVIKALIALKVEKGVAPKNVVRVRPTHDVLTLWADAGLPTLTPGGKLFLLEIKSLLYWSSRYAAPRSDKHREEELEAQSRVRSKALIQQPGLTWENFDKVFAKVIAEFDALYRP